jgi:hypothetical protein
MNKRLQTSYIKLASIPILGSVLLYLLIRNKPAEQTPAPNVVVASDVKVVESKPAIKPVAIDTVVHSQWPVYQLRDFEDVDPFDRRALFPELAPVSNSNESVPSEPDSLVNTTSVLVSQRLQQIKIQAVFQTPVGVAALVNDRIVNVGDRLEDGAEVVEIHPDHLVVSVSSIH